MLALLGAWVQSLVGELVPKAAWHSQKIKKKKKKALFFSQHYVVSFVSWLLILESPEQSLVALQDVREPVKSNSPPPH